MTVTKTAEEHGTSAHDTATAESVLRSPCPGPKGGWLVGNLPEFRRDMLGFFTRLSREYGDVVSFRLGPIKLVALSHPALIEEVLVTKARSFEKPPIMKRLAGPALGNGLVTSEGKFWLRQRRLVQPAFDRQHIEAYGAIAVDCAERMLAGWRDGQTRDLAEEMMQLTLVIVAKTLLDVDVSGEAAAVGRALDVVLKDFSTRLDSLMPLPHWIPSPRNVRLRRAVGALDRVIGEMIATRRASGAESEDLLSRLIRARDEDDGEGMTDRQLRDELMTLFLAGHETTANALAWTWHLLTTHPDAYARLLAEIDEVLDGRVPTVADLPRLVYTERVLKESMRLFPPVPGIGRVAVADCTIGDYAIPRGTSFEIMQWVVHRDPRWYDDPDSFLPERWEGDFEKTLPKCAYFPFSVGPRVCIGNRFAMMEATLVLATVAQRFRLEADPAQRVEPFASITLRPAHGISARLRERSPGHVIET